MHKLTVAIFFTCFFSAVASSKTANILRGNEKGNGGYVLACDNNFDYELLDFYESLHIYNFEFNPELVEQQSADIIHPTETQILDRLFFLLQQRSPSWYRRLQPLRDSYFGRRQWVGGQLGNSQDTEHVFLPQNCSLEQAAIQRLNFLSKYTDFFISQGHWEKMTELRRAGLSLHEILYFGSKQNNSKTIRRLVGWLFSKEFAQSNSIEIDAEFERAEILDEN